VVCCCPWIITKADHPAPQLQPLPVSATQMQRRQQPQQVYEDLLLLRYHIGVGPCLQRIGNDLEHICGSGVIVDIKQADQLTPGQEPSHECPSGDHLKRALTQPRGASCK